MENEMRYTDALRKLFEVMEGRSDILEVKFDRENDSFDVISNNGGVHMCFGKEFRYDMPEKKIREKVIDEFLHNAETKICDRILQNQARLDFASGLSVANRILDEVAEEMKAEL